MSYNLYAEGDLDILAVARVARNCTEVEVFPITEDRGNDAIGMAVPLHRANAAAVDELRTLIGHLLSVGASVFDLHTGEEITELDELDALSERLLGP